MLKNIHLSIEANSHIIKNSKALYKNNSITDIPALSTNETFIDYVDQFNQDSLSKSNKDVFYIFFSGKQIKQPINRKLTLITIAKLNIATLLSDLHSIDNFEIGNHEYKLKEVNNLIPCDLLYAEGGIFDANEIHSAMFFPYFMENRNVEGKVTLIFVNIMFERFKTISKVIFNTLGFKLILDHEEISLDNINKIDFSNWITLHEYAHNSGPLSLFTSNAAKFSTKKYGLIEELRVDLTSFKIILDHLYPIDSNYLKVIPIIILERIFRGALYNYRPQWDIEKNGMFTSEVEGDVSIALMILLEKYNLINFEEKTISITKEVLKKLTEEILIDIYKYEQLASEKNAFSKTAINFASLFRGKYLNLSPTIIRFLNIHSVQNCEYQLSFTDQ